MIDYNLDDNIKFEYGAVVRKRGFQINQVGPDVPEEIDEASFVYTDDNSIFVADAGDDSAAGTQANPVATIAAAVDLTDDEHTYIIVVSNALFPEDFSGCDFQYLQGIYAATGYAPTLTRRKLTTTPTNSNRIFFSALTGYPTGDGTRENPVDTIAGAAALCDASHQICHCLDSETYEEEAFEFTGNFLGLEAAEGEAPILSPLFNRSFYSIGIDVSAASLEIALTGTGSLCSIPLSNGNVVLFNASNYYVYDEAHVLVSSGTLSGLTGTVATIQGCMGSDGLLFIVYRTTDPKTYWAKINTDSWALSGTVHEITESGAQVLAVGSADSNTKACLIWRETDGSVMYYQVLSIADGSVLKSRTTIYSGVASDLYAGFGCSEITGGWYVVYGLINGVVYDGYSAIISSSDYSLTSSGDALSITSIYGLKSCSLEDNLIGLIYGDYTGVEAAPTYYRVIDPTDNSIVKSDVSLYTASYSFEYALCMSLSGHTSIFMTIYAGGANTVFELGVYNKTDSIRGDGNASINGWILEPGDEFWLDNFIFMDAASLSLLWSRIRNTYIEDNYLESLVLLSDGACIIKNSLAHDFSKGLKVVNNSIDIEDNQIYRGMDYFAIEIDGAGSGIIIEHNDIFNNYGAIYLENNDGDEVIKNNIIHDNDNGSVAETSVDCDYSVVTDDNTNLAVGTKFVRANPLYIDEGSVNPSNLDLNIKTRLAGYQTDSPAYGLADDDRNAGAIDVAYIGEETTYTEITVKKPIRILPRLTAVNPSFNQRRSGGIASSKEGQTLYIDLEWEGPLNDDVDDLEDMWCSDDSEVRIYFQPDTYPSQYEVFKMKYADFDEGVDVFTLGDVGVEKIKMTFGRSYER